MEYMTIKEASEKWNLSERRVQTICNEGMVPGVMKFGHSWAIPREAEKLVDKRVKTGKINIPYDGFFVGQMIVFATILSEQNNCI